MAKTPNRLIEKLKKKRTLPLGWTAFAMLLIAATFFVLGSRSDILFANFASAYNKGLPAQLDFSELNDLYALLRSNYDGKLDSNALLDGAKKGMVSATGDPYTTYFTDTEANQFLSDLDGRFSGIGAELGKRESNLTIISTLDGSPAQKAGLLAGDIIGKVNDQDAISWEVEKAVATIRGQKGTSVKLLIVRGNETKEFSVTRDDIVDPSVKPSIGEGNVGYLRLSRFNQVDTVNLATKAAEDFKAKNVKGVVLDLRGNGGGFVDVAQAIAGLWLDGDKVVAEERQDGRVLQTLKATGTPVLKGTPTVVLIDGGSASASEIVAGALRDHGAATLMGERSFGKGSVQRVEDVRFGGQLKVTVAKWFTPKGKNIDRTGIEPDKKMPFNAEELKSGKDTQKDAAIEFVKRKQ
ncbi:MAG TPA: S41 family peptidase [Candidatus Saccharimonadales bacterium]